jgi:hypothetical protein
VSTYKDRLVKRLELVRDGRSDEDPKELMQEAFELMRYAQWGKQETRRCRFVDSKGFSKEVTLENPPPYEYRFPVRCMDVQICNLDDLDCIPKSEYVEFRLLGKEGEVALYEEWPGVRQ